MKLELKKIGNSTGLILPKELLARLGLTQGDSVIVTEGPNKSISISQATDDDEETINFARGLMKEYRATLSVLAK